MKRKRYKTAQIVPIIDNVIISSLLHNSGNSRAYTVGDMLRNYVPEHDWQVACETAARMVIQYLEDEEEKDENPHL